MFEGYTLEQQRRFEEQRGWKPSYAALSYCTAEGVICRMPEKSTSILDCEILDAKRISGAPDCLGKRQGKWGTYVKPTDRSPQHAMQRGLQELFGWDISTDRLTVTSTIGPWLHKAKLALDNNDLVLHVLEDQGEVTPFVANLFAVNAIGFELGSGGYLKAVTDARWTTLRELILQQGQNEDYLYWTMIARCLDVADEVPSLGANACRYFSPGKYHIPILYLTHSKE